MSSFDTTVANNNENLKKEYHKLTEFLETLIKKTNDVVLTSIKDFILQSFYGLSKDNLLKGKDEEIFEYCNYINNCYGEFLTLYNERKDKIISNSKKEILDGINTILNSQINQYFEIYDQTGINPILEEKMLIIKQYIDKFLIYYDQEVNSFKNMLSLNMHSLIIPDILLADDKEEFYKKILFVQLQTHIFPLLFESYNMFRTKCQHDISDLESRKITAKYLENIKLEQEILDSISKNQLPMLLNIDDEQEKDWLKKLLNIIIVANGYLNKKANNFNSFLLNADDVINSFSQSEFENQITDYVNLRILNSEDETLNINNVLYKSYLYISNNFNEIIYFLLKKNLESKVVNVTDVFKSNYKQIDKMTHELLKIIKILTNYYESYRDILIKSDTLGIIKGINETMEIKIETIIENFEEFKKVKNDIVKSFYISHLSITESEKKQILENLFFEIKSLKINIDELYMNFNSKQSILNFIIQNKLCQIEESAEKITKKITKYKQQNILSEIVTFQEIEFYSVEKLRQSQEESIVNYVDVYLKVMNNIQNLLDKNHITRICPNPHDLFIAREHEILVAELKNGFEKGEIIKTVNIGFKEKDEVLIRANVIAAR